MNEKLFKCGDRGRVHIRKNLVFSRHTPDHNEYAELGVAQLCEKLVPNGVFTDMKSFYDPAALAAAGAKVWRL